MTNQLQHLTADELRVIIQTQQLALTLLRANLDDARASVFHAEYRARQAERRLRLATTEKEIPA